jgi:hypothetical protein
MRIRSCTVAGEDVKSLSDSFAANNLRAATPEDSKPLETPRDPHCKSIGLRILDFRSALKDHQKITSSDPFKEELELQSIFGLSFFASAQYINFA